MADYYQNQNQNEHIDHGPNQQPYPNGPQNEYRNPYNPYPPRPPKQRNGFATAALISGILAIINLCCFAFPTAIILGVGTISLAFISKKDQRLSTAAKAAIFLGAGAIVFGVGEYFAALNMIEFMKAPENIAQFNKMFEEAERILESQEALRETITH